MHKYYILHSELLDIVNEKGLTDLFAISRFECSTYLLGAASRAHHPVIKLKKT